MCLLLETIKIEDGQIRNLEFHNRRFNSSRMALFGSAGKADPDYGDHADLSSLITVPGSLTGPENDQGNADHADLSSLITVPRDLGAGIFRCRVLYRREIEKIEFIPHQPRIVRSLKLIEADEIDYSLKYADRSMLELLFARRGNCDEILIVKEGFITDTSIINIVFRQKDGSWATPDTPLLNGTMRMHLLESGQITEAPIRPEDLPAFTGAKMINCMMDLKTAPLIEMVEIKI